MGSDIPGMKAVAVEGRKWPQFHSRRGTGPQPFAQRLARARLLFLRRRELAANWLALVVVLACCVGSAASAQAAPPDDIRAGTLLLRERGGASRPAVRVDTRIDAQVNGMIARVTVRQQFRNDTPEWMDAVYVFPLSEKAAVDRLEMHIGERVIVGEVREREAARKVFEKARSSGQQASLVEQERPNLFTSAVANIPPGESIDVEIGYLESLDYTHEQWSLRIPLTITPRYIPGATSDATGESGAPRVVDAARVSPPVDPGSPQSQRASIRVSVDAGFPLASLRSLHHVAQVTESEHQYTAHLSGETVPADRDFELVWSPQLGAAPAAAAFTETVGSDTYALLMLVPPHETAAQQAAPREVIFIIDTSGSMEGPSIRQARSALTMALERLAPRDRFNVIQFNSTCESLFQQPVQATASNQDVAREYVAGLEANNGTEMRPALQAAFAMPTSSEHLRQIVFITDGAVGNEEELLALIRRELGDARLFTVGIGAAPNGHFMRSAAAFGRGTFTFIGAEQDVQERMGQLFEKIESPALTDIQLRWPAGVTAELALAAVPDVYHGEPVVVTARLNGPVKGLLSLTGRGASGYWLRQIPLSIATPNSGVAALWARTRIDDLLDQRRSGADSEVIRGQVIALALAHRLVSPFTSLVAVDRTPVRPAGTQSGNAAVPNTAPAGSAWSGAAVGYPAAATSASLQLLIGLGLLVLAIVVFGLRREQRA